MADKNDDVLQDLLDPKKLLEQLRECETKQFKNAIDLLQECEERHRRNEKKLSRLTIASSAGAAIIGKEAAEEVGTYVTTVESILTGDVGAISDAAGDAGVNLSDYGISVDANGNPVFPGGFGFWGGGAGAGGAGAGNMGVNPMKANPSNDDESSEEDEEKGKKDKEEEEAEEEEEEEEEEE